MGRLPTWAAVLMAAIGLAFLAGGGWFLAESYGFSSRAERTEGEVVEVRPTSNTKFVAVLAYEDADGTARQGETHVAASHYDYKVGATVTILYDPAEPGTVRVEEWVLAWAIPGLFAGTGLTILLLLLVLRRRRD